MDLPTSKKNNRKFDGSTQRIKFRIALLDELVPKGFPSNSFILISGEGGIAKSTMVQNIVFNFLKSKYGCFYICIDEHPLSVYQNMILQGFDIKNYCEKGQMLFVDMFSYRLNLSNEEVVRLKNIIAVNYPTNWQSLLSLLLSHVNILIQTYNKALVVIDSLTELLNKLDMNSVLDFVKSARFEICKKKKIPIFATSHFGIKTFEDFEQVLDYHVDGIFDLRYDPVAMQYGFLVKQIRIRKLRSSLHSSKWHSFEIVNGRIVKSRLENLTQKVGSLNVNL